MKTSWGRGLVKTKRPKGFIFIEVAAFALAASSIMGVTPDWVVYIAIAVMVVSFFVMFALMARRGMKDFRAAAGQTEPQVSGLLFSAGEQQTGSAGSSSTLPNPGYYPDPENPGMERWWNGQGWSDSRRPAG